MVQHLQNLQHKTTIGIGSSSNEATDGVMMMILICYQWRNCNIPWVLLPVLTFATGDDSASI